MANKLYEEENVRAIANAIRAKNGTTDTYTVAQMADAILALSAEGSGSVTPTGSVEITTNGTHDVTNYASAVVNVPTEGIIPTGSITITENGTFDVTNYASAVVSATQTYENLPSNIHVGTFTVDESKNTSSPVTVNHNIGSIPIVIYIMVDEVASVTENATVGSTYVNGTGQSYIYANGALTYKTVSLITDVDETSFVFTAAADARPIKAGLTYRWFAWT